MSTFDQCSWTKIFLAEVDRVVCLKGRCDQVLGVKKTLVTMNQRFGRDRVHVVDENTVVDLVAIDPEITSVVSGNHIVANTLPLSRTIEHLVQITVETERRVANLTLQEQICVAILESLEPTEPRV